MSPAKRIISGTVPTLIAAGTLLPMTMVAGCSHPRVSEHAPVFRDCAYVELHSGSDFSRSVRVEDREVIRRLWNAIPSSFWSFQRPRQPFPSEVLLYVGYPANDDVPPRMMYLNIHPDSQVSMELSMVNFTIKCMPEYAATALAVQKELALGDHTGAAVEPATKSEHPEDALVVPADVSR